MARDTHTHTDRSGSGHARRRAASLPAQPRAMMVPQQSAHPSLRPRAGGRHAQAAQAQVRASNDRARQGAADRATAVGRRRAFQKDGSALPHIFRGGHELPQALPASDHRVVVDVAALLDGSGREAIPSPEHARCVGPAAARELVRAPALHGTLGRATRRLACLRVCRGQTLQEGECRPQGRCWPAPPGHPSRRKAMLSRRRRRRLAPQLCSSLQPCSTKLQPTRSCATFHPRSSEPVGPRPRAPGGLNVDDGGESEGTLACTRCGTSARQHS